MPARRKCGPRRRSRPTPSRDALDVGADELADVGDLVDERDARHQECVRGELDHLGGVDVGTHHRRVDPGVQCRDASPSSWSYAPTTIRSGFMKSPHCGALGGELRIRDVADAGEAPRVEGGAHLLAGADGNGRLHHDRRAHVLRQLVDDRPDARQIGVARVERRRVDADVDELRAVERLANVERVAKPRGVAASSSSRPGS